MATGAEAGERDKVFLLSIDAHPGGDLEQLRAARIFKICCSGHTGRLHQRWACHMSTRHDVR